MVFADDWDGQFMERYSTYKEAEEGHEEMVRRMRELEEQGSSAIARARR
jgi:hypothetical protein